MCRLKSRLAVFICLFIAVLGADAAIAQVVINPGQTRTFQNPDGGGTDCVRGEIEGASGILDCEGFRFQGTEARPDPITGSPRARARVTVLTAPSAGIPLYATARLYKDFSIRGEPNNLVPVQFSATFDYRNFFLMGAAYLTQSSVSLRIRDRTSGVDISTHTLFETSRDGDQGFTDVALADERQVLEGANGSFSTLLRRGHEYRIFLELEVMGQALVAGAFEADARIEWKKVRVSVDEDEVDLLATHDEAIHEVIAVHDQVIRSDVADHDDAIRAQVGQHDDDIKTQIAVHDADIKALLMELRERQHEIIRLLLTPQGQRESDLGSWPLTNNNGQGQAGAPGQGDPEPPVQGEPEPPAQGEPESPGNSGGARGRRSGKGPLT